MKKRYFICKGKKNYNKDREWQELNGQQFYELVNSDEGKEKHYENFGDYILIINGDVEIENFADRKHQVYINKLCKAVKVVSLNSCICQDGKEVCAEECFADESVNIEEEITEKIMLEKLSEALKILDEKEYSLIYELILSDKPKTERQLAHELGIKQSSVNKKRRMILQKLKKEMRNNRK